MARRIHIIVAEPSLIIRCGVVTLLQRASAINIDVAEVNDVSLLFAGSLKQLPDVLIVNPSNIGLYPIAQIKSNIGNDQLKIIALQSVYTDQSLLQNYDEQFSIYDGIESIKEKIVSLMNENGDDGSKKDLSVREKEIVVSVVKGMTNKQIAEQLCLSTHTVIAHRRNIANKLQIHSPSGLTIYAIVNKLVDLAEVKNTISQNKDSESV